MYKSEREAQVMWSESRHCFKAELTTAGLSALREATRPGGTISAHPGNGPFRETFAGANPQGREALIGPWQKLCVSPDAGPRFLTWSVCSSSPSAVGRDPTWSCGTEGKGQGTLLREHDSTLVQTRASAGKSRSQATLWGLNRLYYRL